MTFSLHQKEKRDKEVTRPQTDTIARLRRGIAVLVRHEANLNVEHGAFAVHREEKLRRIGVAANGVRRRQEAHDQRRIGCGGGADDLKAEPLVKVGDGVPFLFRAHRHGNGGNRREERRVVSDPGATSHGERVVEVAGTAVPSKGGDAVGGGGRATSMCALMRTHILFVCFVVSRPFRVFQFRQMLLQVVGGGRVRVVGARPGA